MLLLTLSIQNSFLSSIKNLTVVDGIVLTVKKSVNSLTPVSRVQLTSWITSKTLRIVSLEGGLKVNANKEKNLQFNLMKTL